MRLIPIRRIGINLTGESKELFGKVLTGWAVNSGRVIIVATELIALGALLYRFIVDRRIINLQDTIAKQEQTLSILAPQEATYRNIQARLLHINSLTDSTNKIITAYLYMLGLVSTKDFNITQIALNKNQVAVDGSTSSVFALNDLIETLKKNDEMDEISLDQIESKEGKIEFKIKAKLKSIVPDPAAVVLPRLDQKTKDTNI